MDKSSTAAPAPASWRSEGAVELFDSPAPLLRRHRQTPATVKVMTGVVLGVLTLAMAALLVLLQLTGQQLDEQSALESNRQFNSLLSLQSTQLASKVKDYAQWDEAIESILIRRDAKWWDANAGAYVVDSFDLSFSLAIDGRNKVLLWASDPSETAKAPVVNSNPALRAIVDQARRRPLNRDSEDIVATGLVQHAGQLHMVAAVKMQTQKGSTLRHPDPDALLIYAQSLTGTLLPIAGSVMGVGVLTWESSGKPGQVSAQINLADGRSAGVVSWSYPNLGGNWVRTMLPWVSALFLLVVTTIVYAIWRTRRVVNELLDEDRLINSLEERHQSLLNVSRDAIVGLDRDGRIRFLNQIASHTLGLSANLLMGRELAEVLGRQEAREGLKSAISQGGTWHGETSIETQSEGPVRLVELTVASIKRVGTVNDSTVGAVVVLHDLTQQQKFEQSLQHKLHFDVVTGAPNRVWFLQKLSESIEQAQHEAEPLAVLLMDLDRFRKVNDTMGHPVGDQLLRQVYARLSRVVPETAFVARLGSDEFGIILPQPTDRAIVGDIAQRMLETLRDMFRIQGYPIWTSGHLGIAVYPADGQEAMDLLRAAEIAMYKAKEHGHLGFGFFDPAQTENLRASHALELSLRRAIEKNQLVLHYQPIVDMRTHRLSHLEALVRWADPERGLVRPDLFIPLAEETGLINEIGSWVLHEGCRQLADWRSKGVNTNVGLAINLSGKQVPNGLSIKTVQDALLRHGVSGQLLNFELTESVLFDKSEIVRQWLDQIRALGIKFMIDDFGTGYSSLSYIKHIQAHAIKIDKAFVAGVVDHMDDQSLVTAILAMAHSLRLPVVAEGVETQEQWDWLKARGCDYAQGYLMGRPAPANEWLDWVSPV